MKNSKGFTLIELAIVLIIVGILLGGGMTLFTTQQEILRVEQTNALLAEVKEALIGFAMANGRLPCPAPASAVTGTATAGREPTPILAAGCTNVAGVLPWATLGVSETDAWGNRFTYRVTREFTRGLSPAQTNFPSCGTQPNPTPADAAFALCSVGDMNILNTAGGNSVSINVPVVVLSHGSNGKGAYTPQGTQMPQSTNANEIANTLTGGTSLGLNLVSNTGTFDDLVTWVPTHILINRMVSAGKLP